MLGIGWALGVLGKFLPKLLGYGVVAGSAFSRVPQIKTIYEQRSAKGLSVLTFEIETAVNAVAVMYNFERPFSNWGEAAMLLLQYLVMMALIYKHSRQVDRGFMVGGSFLLFVLLWFAGYIPHLWISTAFSLSVVSLGLARGNQVRTNFVNGNTGVLAPATLTVNVVGTAIRLYTNYVEVPSPPLSVKMQYYIAFTLNAILMWQYFYLGPVRPSSKHHGQGRSGRAGHDAQKDTSAHGKAREGAGRDKGVREGGGRETGGPASRTRSKGT